jgi:hypothetical protein
MRDPRSVFHVHSSKSRVSSMILLSVLVPVSLLAAFRITGIIPEPPTPQIIAVETVYWNMSRPSSIEDMVGEWANNSYSDSSAFVGLNIGINNYLENDQVRGDSLALRIFLEAKVNDGFFDTVVTTFSNIDANAFVDIAEDPDHIELQNLSINTIRDSFETNQPYIEARSPSRSKQVALAISVYWMFMDRNNMDHWITLTAEITCFNGAEYQKVVIPIRLGVFVPQK